MKWFQVYLMFSKKFQSIFRVSKRSLKIFHGFGKAISSHLRTGQRSNHNQLMGQQFGARYPIEIVLDQMKHPHWLESGANDWSTYHDINMRPRKYRRDDQQEDRILDLCHVLFDHNMIFQ